MTNQIATFGGGCFWCIEAIFQNMKGVASVESGYMGGETINPTYSQITTGETRHAEVVQISYDAELVSYQDLLEVFFSIHDPTSLNRQGADIGTQYRSVIFYHSPEQKQLAEAMNQAVSSMYFDEIVTEVTEKAIFYKAEGYHQNYYLENIENRYCAFVVAPKLAKFRERFVDKLKAGE